MRYSDIFKAASRKYLKRIPTGDPKRPWRYVYRDSSNKQSKKTPAVVEKESPLEYSGASGVKRLAIEDAESPAPERTNSYFSAGEPDVAFLDYSLYDGGSRVFIHYANTRMDKQGEGAARVLVNALYDRFKGAKEINWGKIMSDPMEALYQEKKEEGKVPTYGKVW